MTPEQTTELQLLAEDYSHWTNEASIQGSKKIVAEQRQLRALDEAKHALQKIIELIRDARSESQSEDQTPA